MLRCVGCAFLCACV